MSKEEANNNQEPSIQLKPMTLMEIARLYGVSRKTILKWKAGFDKELGPIRGRYYTIKQVKMFFENLGIPSTYTEK